MIRIALVGQAKVHAPWPGPVAARCLYDSVHFRADLARADATCTETLVVSAAHGVTYPDVPLLAYDLTLDQVDADAWGKMAAGQIRAMIFGPAILVAFCHDAYIKALEPHLTGYVIERPEAAAVSSR
jgi:hypothetical protein